MTLYLRHTQIEVQQLHEGILGASKHDGSDIPVSTQQGILDQLKERLPLLCQVKSQLNHLLYVTGYMVRANGDALVNLDYAKTLEGDQQWFSAKDFNEPYTGRVSEFRGRPLD